MDTYLRIAGLIFGCPLGLKLESCPFYELRNKTGIEKFQYLKGISQRELQNLELIHLECFNECDINGRK